jgi:hypothetical protein
MNKGRKIYSSITVNELSVTCQMDENCFSFIFQLSATYFTGLCEHCECQKLQSGRTASESASNKKRNPTAVTISNAIRQPVVKRDQSAE